MDSDAVEQTSSVVDFQAYGLDDTFTGARWVDFFEGLPGRPPWALWLGHREPDADSGVRVGTLPKRRYEAVMCPNGKDPLVEVAFSGAFGVVNVTLPDSSVPRPDGLIPALVEHAEHEAQRYADWPIVWWRLEGAQVRARVWHFAGGWAAFCTALDDVYLVVVGIGMDPADLAFAPVTDGAEYGADLAAPLDFAELGRRKSVRPEAWLPPPRRDSFHPDQLAFVPDEPEQ
ncbi:hypothetical protein [Saccharomonospora piscinae]|uniref:Uncharacterized protein n=1 Tax=Saccharomonospora piscinae TaxID=687388 RepID=A0A1V9A6T9_SACPI|nr:hypothetical protein [Saccharomonospora piscinae]OQO92813.1 hypothetical protein B1813_11790 [Saccharomonospora piscinae]TLW92950.1 hypothetical protein FFT09_05740 [Saccharomonospora piscinae]